MKILKSRKRRYVKLSQRLKRKQRQKGGQTTSGLQLDISIYSGGGPIRQYINGNISVAKYNEPWGITKDSLGNMYISDKANNCIRKIDTAGNVTTFAGVQDDAANTAARIRVPVNPGYVNGKGTAAKLRRPQGIVCDKNNNLFFVETDNHVVRKIDPTGLVTTFAGPPATTANNGGQTIKGFVNGASATATFNQPFGITIDSKNNLYVADNQNNAIRKIDASGNVTTFAGGSSGNTDGTGTAAKFKFPYAVVCDLSDNLFVADYMNGAIRMITPAGVVKTIAGGTGLGYVDGVKTAAKLRPIGLTLGPNNSIFVADGDPEKNAPAGTAHRIRMVDIATGRVTTFAGNGTQPLINTISSNGLFNNPSGMLYDSFYRKLYIVNTGILNPPSTSNVLGNYINVINLVGITINNVVIPPPPTTTIAPTTTRVESAIVTTIGGGGNGDFFITGANEQFMDGDKSVSRFYRPMGVTAYNGNVYIADAMNNRIRMINSTNIASTFINDPLLSIPTAVAFNSSGDMYIVNGGRNNILKYSGSSLSVFAGSPSGENGLQNGENTSARFKGPSGIAIDPTGNLIVTDTNNSCLRKITPNGLVSTLVSGLNGPIGVAIDATGIIYVANTLENTILKVNSDGSTSIIAGIKDILDYKDGPATTALFRRPAGIAIDSQNNLYITDMNNSRIRKITSSGMVLTLAGNGDMQSVGIVFDGTGSKASFWAPVGITIDSNKNIFVADWRNHRIRKLVPVII